MSSNQHGSEMNSSHNENQKCPCPVLREEYSKLKKENEDLKELVSNLGKSKLTKYQVHRLFFSIFYFIIAVICFICFWLFLRNDTVLPRLIWCLGWSAFGFAILAFVGHTHPNPAPSLPFYLTSYPLLLIAISSLTFSILQIFEKKIGETIFYPLSFSICSILSLKIDTLPSIIGSVLGNAKK